MGRLNPNALACVLVVGCCGADDRAQPDASTVQVNTQSHSYIAAKKSAVETLLILGPQLEGTRDRALLFASAGTVFARAGMRDRATDAFDRAIQVKADARTTGELALRSVDAGLYDKAVEIVMTIGEDRARGAAIERVVRALIAAEELDRAHQLAQRLTAVHWIRALASVAEGFSRAGRKTEAVGALQKAFEVREAQGADILSPVDTAELARVSALIVNKETAEELFEEAFDRVSKKQRTPTAESQRTATMVEILGRYAAAGILEEAREQAAKLRSALREVQAQVRIAVAYRERGRMKHGFDVLGATLKRTRRMPASCAKASAIKEVAVGYARIGTIDKVSHVADLALQVLEKVKARDKADCRSANVVLRELASVGACDSIWRQIGLIEDTPSQIEMLIECGGRCVEARISPAAVQMLIRADELVTAHGVGEKTPKWAEIARHLARAREYDFALKVAAKISPASRFKTNALAWIVEGYLLGAGDEVGGVEEQALLQKVWAQLPEL